MKKKIILSTLTVLFCMAGYTFNASAQVQIAPVALYMNDDRQTGRVIVRNSSSEPQELNIDLVYGYPATDEAGNVYLKKFESVPDNAPSAKDWVRVYPRHLVLPPQQQQTIRFSARPPAGLPPGEYWVRPAISSSDDFNRENGPGEKISANFNMIKRTLLSLNYRRGDVQTGIGIDNLSASVSDTKLHLMADLNRKGNAAYLGEAEIKITGPAGEPVHRLNKEIAVYHSQSRRFEVNIGALAPGSYRVELSLDTRKRAEENDAILSAPPARESLEFTVE